MQEALEEVVENTTKEPEQDPEPQEDDTTPETVSLAAIASLANGLTPE